MADNTKDIMQPAGNATSTSNATSPTSKFTDNRALRERDEATRRASDGDAPNNDDHMAAPDDDNTLSSSSHLNKDPASPINVDRWIQLYHHLLLIAALQPSRPVIHLNHSGALQLNDAYTKGRVTFEGIVGPLPAPADAGGIAVFKRVCENLVPSIVGRIEELSKKNSEDNSTRIPDDGTVFPNSLWEFVITPEMISHYSLIRDRFDVDDEVVEPEKDRELREFLEGIIAETYGIRDGEAAAPGKKIKLSLKKQPLDKCEKFKTVNDKTRAYYKAHPQNSELTYTQEDEIPDWRDALSSPSGTIWERRTSRETSTSCQRAKKSWCRRPQGKACCGHTAKKRETGTAQTASDGDSHWCCASSAKTQTSTPGFSAA